jgi:hypothetical protein
MKPPLGEVGFIRPNGITNSIVHREIGQYPNNSIPGRSYNVIKARADKAGEDPVVSAYRHFRLWSASKNHHMQLVDVHQPDLGKLARDLIHAGYRAEIVADALYLLIEP